jgi:hypothetical protein
MTGPVSYRRGVYPEAEALSTNTAFFSLEALPNYPKNALNCAYLNLAFSEHDYFDL